MADPAPSAKFNLHAPVFDGGDAESFNLWLSQFQRYIRVTKPAEDDKLDLFLLCAGNKAAQFKLGHDTDDLQTQCIDKRLNIRCSTSTRSTIN